MKVKRSMVHRHKDEEKHRGEKKVSKRAAKENNHGDVSSASASRRQDPWAAWDGIDLDAVRDDDAITLDAMTMAGIRRNKGLLDMIIDGIDQGLLGYRESNKEPVYVFDGNEDESVGHFTIYSKGSTVTMLQANAGLRAYFYNMMGRASDESERLREQSNRQLEELQAMRVRGVACFNSCGPVDETPWQCHTLANGQGVAETMNEIGKQMNAFMDGEGDDEGLGEEESRPVAKRRSTKTKQCSTKTKRHSSKRRSTERRRPVGGAITIHNAEEFFQALSLKSALLEAARRQEEEEEKKSKAATAAEERDDDSFVVREEGGGSGSDSGSGSESKGTEQQQPQPAGPTAPTASLSNLKPLEAIMLTWQSRTKSNFGIKGLDPLDENVETTDMNISKSYFSGANVSVEEEEQDGGDNAAKPVAVKKEEQDGGSNAVKPVAVKKEEQDGGSNAAKPVAVEKDEADRGDETTSF